MRGRSRWWGRTLAAISAVVILGGAAPAGAQQSCAARAVESCDREFSAWYYKVLGILAWCYVLRTAQCEVYEAAT